MAAEIGAALASIEQNAARARALLPDGNIEPLLAAIERDIVRIRILHSASSGGGTTGDHVAFVWRRDGSSVQGRDGTLELLRTTYPRVKFEHIEPGDPRRFARTICAFWMQTDRVPNGDQVAAFTATRAADTQIFVVGAALGRDHNTGLTVNFAHHDTLVKTTINHAGNAVVGTSDFLAANPNTFWIHSRRAALDLFLS